MRAHTLAVALLALTAVAAGQRRRDRNASPDGVKGFIRTAGNKFVDDGCGDFVPVGWNSELEEEQARCGRGGGAGPGGREAASFLA
jgi:hypothetical protein